MSSRPRFSRWTLAIPLGVLAIGIAAAWWLVTPDTFPETALPPVEIQAEGSAATYVVGAGVTPGAEVTLASARPRTDDAAGIRVVLCDRPIDVSPGTVEDLCDEVTEVAGATLAPTGAAHLVIEVTVQPDAPVVIEGLALAYTQGLRFGRQAVGRAITLLPSAS